MLKKIEPKKPFHNTDRVIMNAQEAEQYELEIRDCIFERVYEYYNMKIPDLKLEIDARFPEGAVIKGRHHTRGVLRNLNKIDMIFHLVNRLGMMRTNTEERTAWLKQCLQSKKRK